MKKETDLRNPLKEKEITINLKRVTEDYFAEQERQKIKAKVERLKKTYGERVYKDAPLITSENKNGRITLDDIPITIAEIKRINKRETLWTYGDESFERTSRCTTPRCNRIMDGIVRYQDYDGDSMHTEVCQIHSKQKTWRGNKVFEYIPWGQPDASGIKEHALKTHDQRDAWESGIQCGMTRMLPPEIQEKIMQLVCPRSWGHVDRAWEEEQKKEEAESKN